MQGSPGVPTWRIVPDTAVESQWRFEPVDEVSRPPEPPRGTLGLAGASHRLPSMSDLLAQASQKLSEDHRHDGPGIGGDAPMFRTGSGKAVSVNQSSMKRARSVLEAGSEVPRGSFRAGAGEGAPVFQTAAGVPVEVSGSSLRKAASILGEELMEQATANDGGVPLFQTGLGQPVHLRKGSVQAASSVLNGVIVDVPTFQTGSGMPVDVRRSSMQKAASILGDDFATEAITGFGGLPMFQTGSGRPVHLSKSSMQAASLLLGETNTDAKQVAGDRSTISTEDCNKSVTSADHGDNVDRGHGESFPIFQTGSGKPVRFSKTSLHAASSLLGGIITGPEPSCNIASMNKKNRELGPFAPEVHIEDRGNNGSLPMFQTGLGRSMTIRKSSMQKAAAILGGGLGLEGAEESNDHQMFEIGKCGSVQSNTVHKPASEQGVDSGGDRTESSTSSFQKGLGPSITVRRSSIEKAVAMLGNGERMETGSKAPLDGYIESTMSRGYRPQDRFSNTGLHSPTKNNTGCGQPVDITLAGLHRADMVPCLKRKLPDSMGLEPAPGIVNQEDQSCITKSDLNGMFCQSLGEPSVSRSVNKNLSICLRNRLLQNSSRGSFQQMDSDSSVSSSASIGFQTMNGHSYLIPNISMEHANNLLTEPNAEVLQSKTNQNNVHSKINERNISVGSHKAVGHHMKTELSHLRIKSSTRGVVNSQCIPPNAPTADNSSHEIALSPTNKIPSSRSPPAEDMHMPHTGLQDSMAGASSRVALADITNRVELNSSQMNAALGRKGLRQGSSISPFKKPRVSRFLNPFNRTSCFISPFGSASDSSAPKVYTCQTNFSSHYPPKFKRKSLMEFFGRPCPHMHVPQEIRSMTPDKAEKFVFSGTCGLGVGVDSIKHMLLQLGASSSNLSTEWVTNHYKWIIWKLACLERCFPDKALGKYLTISNVLDELKYRYEREVNYGHRSAIKRILDGDASPASSVVLCVSSVPSKYSPKEGEMEDTVTKNLKTSDQAESDTATVELTDGWYSMNAVLDVALSKLLLSRKLFVGQKLRIWGAGISGWVGPVSPFEALASVSLVLHINGTYRTHWAQKLGFCKEASPPLSFNCIKSGGGVVPLTLLGVSRIYPVLYKERFNDGGSVVRSERMEKKVLQLYSQRRADISEDIISEQRDYYTHDGDCEGAKISRILQAAAEPEVLMADMTAEQLSSFTAFQEKREVARQSDLCKKIEKALEEAGLVNRDVTSFMRIRVVGVESKGTSRKGRHREGLITIWNPTESQKSDLVEGEIYSVTSLFPVTVCADVIYLRARGPSCIWRHIPSSEKFEPFHGPRKSVLVSCLGEIPLTSEFDLAAVVVYVGETYHSGWQRKQWLFAADGSGEDSHETEVSNISLVAINFSASVIKDEPPTIVNQGLSGSTVGFYNLVKRPRDRINQFWVAEATENSTYSLYHSIPDRSHLKEAAENARHWAKHSAPVVESLKEKILDILGGLGAK